MAETEKDKKPKAATAASESSTKKTTKAAADKPAKATAKAATSAAEKPAKAAKSTTAKADKPAAAKADKPAASAKADKPAAAKADKPAASAKAPKAPAEGAGGTLKLHHLRPAPGAHTAKTRVGRGEASKGKTAGRGTKGTKARYQVPQRFEGGQMPMHMRLPKLRGFKNPFRTEYQVVNLDKLVMLYPQGGDVTVEDLVAKGAVRKGAPVKVLGDGDVSVKLTVSVQKVSATAAEKILAAGGTITQD